MPNQSPAIDSFNVLHHTAVLCVFVCTYICVCMKDKLLREHCSQSYIIEIVEIIQQSDKKYGDSVCLFFLIDTNEQGLAEVILTVYLAISELRANRLKGFR